MCYGKHMGMTPTDKSLVQTRTSKALVSYLSNVGKRLLERYNASLATAQHQKRIGVAYTEQVQTNPQRKRTLRQRIREIKRWCLGSAIIGTTLTVVTMIGLAASPAAPALAMILLPATAIAVVGTGAYWYLLQTEYLRLQQTDQEAISQNQVIPVWSSREHGVMHNNQYSAADTYCLLLSPIPDAPGDVFAQLIHCDPAVVDEDGQLVSLTYRIEKQLTIDSEDFVAAAETLAQWKAETEQLEEQAYDRLLHTQQQQQLQAASEEALHQQRQALIDSFQR